MGWNASIFLHEYDHLNGTLYIDKLERDENGHCELYTQEVFKAIEAEKRQNNELEWLEGLCLRCST